jgi:phage recombination protein Bet
MPFSDPSDSDILFPMKTPFSEPSPLSENQLALLRRTVTANLSDDEHALFVQACERSGLDPFARHIYPAKSKQYNPATRKHEETYRPEATIDGLRLTAERTEKYAGQLGPDWCGKDGAWKDIWLSDEPPAAARVGILRADFKEPVWGKALYSEFVQLTPEGQPAPFWFKMASNQLAKCAEALGFRKAFPREFSGIYTRDEMAQAEQFRVELPFQSSEEGLDHTPDNPDHERGPSPAQAHVPGPSVPVPLRVYVNRGTGDRKNVAQAFKYLEDELILSAGLNGSETFKRITSRLPRVYPTREACQAATINCWLELWSEIEKAKAARAA